MDYLPLARRLRPQNFSQIIGQELVAKALMAAIDKQKIAGAYLFSGARGTGKTSLARILAKALNCENLASSEPCSNCLPCREITASKCPDVLEIDAASNRGIERVRELRENITYLPHYCRYKVYIIDEVHMMTDEAFNALLKTLEEPPPNVKFIMATTNPDKLPATILSRTIRFNLNLIPIPVIVKRLSEIATDLNLKLTEQVLYLLAQKSAGSMRDALVGLETIVNLKKDDLELQNIQLLIGWHNFDDVLAILNDAFSENSDGALHKLNQLLITGTSASNLNADFLRFIRTMILSKSIKAHNNYHQQEWLPNIYKKILLLAQQLSLPKLQQAFDLFLDLELKSAKSLFENWMLEITLVKLSHLQDLVGVKEMISSLRQVAKTQAKQTKQAKINTTTIDFSSIKDKLSKTTEKSAILSSSDFAPHNQQIDSENKKLHVENVVNDYKEPTPTKDDTRLDIAKPVEPSEPAKSVVPSELAEQVTPPTPDLYDWTSFLDKNLSNLKDNKLKSLISLLKPIKFDQKVLKVASDNDFIIKTISDKEKLKIKEWLQSSCGFPIDLEYGSAAETTQKSYLETKELTQEKLHTKIKHDISLTEEVKTLTNLLPGKIIGVELDEN
ncbi:MAG: DNA polymerase III subunit gamma/tau [SAR324 cluster bacterium]|nr:DNA polymerase III subunit gamma/tau [SAR324 cluster bacterium]